MVLESKGNASDVVSMVAQKQSRAEAGVPSMALMVANSLMRAAGYETAL
jgi:hypothetical protein